MAKGSLSGVRKGKKGDSVYYRVAASNNKEKQGERQYVGEVTNPRTDAQVEQRMKMAPAVNLYRVLKDDVLDHSFQGVKYGARSHSEFMKIAMTSTLGTIPYVSKGETQAIPAPYIISKGSLPDVGIFGFENNLFKTMIGTRFKSELSLAATYGEFVAALLNENPMLKKGDQLTFVVCGIKNNEAIWGVTRLVLDASKYDASATYINVCQSANVNFELGGLGLSVRGASNIVAAAVILSRPNAAKTNGAITWQRSTTAIYVVPEFMDSWHTEEKLNAAIESYKSKSASPSSDWYLNDGTLG